MSEAMQSHREYFNPIDWLVAQGAPREMLSHITYDETLTPRTCQYRIVRTSAHDGTHAFTIDMIAAALLPLANRESVYKPWVPLADAQAKDIRYVVGPARLARVYRDVDLPVGNYPGQRERIRVPVRCVLAADGP